MKTLKGLVVFGSILLLLVLAVPFSVHGVAGAVEIPLIEGEIPPLPNVRPVIILSGSDYDLGYQWYQQLVQLLGPWILKERVAHPKFSDKEQAALKAYQWYIKKYTPEMIDMFKGMAAGATAAGVPLSYEEVLLGFIKDDLAPLNPQAPVGSENEKFPPDCSGLAAWGSTTTNGKLIALGTTDGEARVQVTFVVFPKTGNNFIYSPMSTVAWAQGHPGINNKGLAYVHHAAPNQILQRPPKDYTYGIPYGIAMVHTLRFANNATEAKNMQLSLPSSDGRLTGFWADVSGNAFVIESRENPVAIRKSGDYGEKDFIYSTNNPLCKELGLKNQKYVDHGGWFGIDLKWDFTKDGVGAKSGRGYPGAPAAVDRNLEIWNFFHNYHGKVNLDFVKMMCRFPSKPPFYPTLEEADAAYYKNQGMGWDTHILTAENGMVGIIIPDNGNEGLYYVNTGGAGRVAYPLKPGADYYRLEQLYSFYQLKLDASPAKVTDAAGKRAKYDMYYANLELRKLNYRDVGYAPLDSIFNQAVKEWLKGTYYKELARKKTKGNETIYNYSKATRAYTRCQALAQQVRESLIPPPTSPEDLGLKPYGAPWGDWATWGVNRAIK